MMSNKTLTLEVETIDALKHEEILSMVNKIIDENILVSSIQDTSFKSIEDPKNGNKYLYKFEFSLTVFHNEIDILMGGSIFSNFLLVVCNDIINEPKSIYLNLDPTTFSVNVGLGSERLNDLFLMNVQTALLMNDNMLLCLTKISDLIIEKQGTKNNFHELAIAVNSLSNKVFGRSILGDKHMKYSLDQTPKPKMH